MCYGKKKRLLKKYLSFTHLIHEARVALVSIFENGRFAAAITETRNNILRRRKGKRKKFFEEEILQVPFCDIG